MVMMMMMMMVSACDRTASDCIMLIAYGMYVCMYVIDHTTRTCVKAWLTGLNLTGRVGRRCIVSLSDGAVCIQASGTQWRMLVREECSSERECVWVDEDGLGYDRQMAWRTLMSCYLSDTHH